MYFIAETKWDKNAGGLSDDEVIKINCAERHFEAVNESVADTVKYAWDKFLFKAQSLRKRRSRQPQHICHSRELL